jgi:N6-adenosine-specific RNA methylase IME4
MSTTPDILTPHGSTTMGVFADAAGSPTPVQITTGAGSGVRLGVGGASVVLADPPWAYESNGAPASARPSLERGEKPHSVEHYYGTMTAEQIAAMPVAEMAAPDSVLFLWATVPLLPEAFMVMKAWGYRYKTMLTWHKLNGKGMGYWFRGVTEHLLLGVRGNVKAFRSLQRNLIECKVGRHSAKPDQFHELIEKVCAPPYLELFSRRARPGWSHFGNQVEHDLFSGVGFEECASKSPKGNADPRHSESGNS